METVPSRNVMDIIEDYKEQHKNPQRYWGASFKRHGKLLQPEIRRRKINSILDFGSGKGKQYTSRNLHELYLWGIMPSLYDPAVQGIDTVPSGTFDAVINTDVLEHIEEDQLDSVLELIYKKANKFAYHGIANWATGRYLADGRDVHLIQEDIDWWVNKIKPHATVPTLVWVATRKGMSGNGIVLIE